MLVVVFIYFLEFMAADTSFPLICYLQISFSCLENAVQLGLFRIGKVYCFWSVCPNSIKKKKNWAFVDLIQFSFLQKTANYLFSHYYVQWDLLFGGMQGFCMIVSQTSCFLDWKLHLISYVIVQWSWSACWNAVINLSFLSVIINSRLCSNLPILYPFQWWFPCISICP